MPTYEFRCNDTGKRFEITVKSFADYDPDAVTSPFTGSHNVSRIIRKVNVKRGGLLNAMMDGDESAISDLENADPAMMGRALREMADEAGEDMGGEFHEIVDRLEKGESPEQIEASLPAPPDSSDI